MIGAKALSDTVVNSVETTASGISAWPLRVLGLILEGIWVTINFTFLSYFPVYKLNHACIVTELFFVNP